MKLRQSAMCFISLSTRLLVLSAVIFNLSGLQIKLQLNNLCISSRTVYYRFSNGAFTSLKRIISTIYGSILDSSILDSTFNLEQFNLRQFNLKQFNLNQFNLRQFNLRQLNFKQFNLKHFKLKQFKLRQLSLDSSTLDNFAVNIEFN